MMTLKIKALIVFIGSLLILAACSDGTLTLTEAVGAADPTQSKTVTLTSTQVPTSTAVPTEVPTPTRTVAADTPTITPTPWDVEMFQSSDLLAGVEPEVYKDDVCEYLGMRWGEGKSLPGTVVVPLMFHSIVAPGKPVTSNDDISMEYFETFMTTAEDMGFETITTEELIGFLMQNDPIPERSMIIIKDDRATGYPALFMPYLEANDWTLTMAYPATDKIPESEWVALEDAAESGRLDFQSHGYAHISVLFLTDDQIRDELVKPMDILEQHFGVQPRAHIWVGGNFTTESVMMAKEAGYSIAFTAYSRGALMFNWIPLGEPEREIGEPLFVLPRYWSTGAIYALKHAVSISEAAKVHAESVREQEMLFYFLFCQPGGE